MRGEVAKHDVGKLEERPAVVGSGEDLAGRTAAVLTGGRGFVGEAVRHRMALDPGMARCPVLLTIFSTKVGGSSNPKYV